MKFICNIERHLI